MSDKKSSEQNYDKFRSGDIDFQGNLDETKTSNWGPSSDWTTQIYEQEYKPLNKIVKIVIKYGIIFLVILFALDQGTQYVRNTLCQWGLDKFCEIEYNSPDH